MVIRSHSPLPEFSADGGPLKRPHLALVALAAALVATTVGLSGDAVVRRRAPIEPPPAAAAAPTATASAASAAAPQPADTIALDVDAGRRTAEENQLVALMNAEAADKVRADETLLPLVTFHIYFAEPVQPTPTSETAVVDGATLRFPVQAYPDNTDSNQHWGYVVRVPHRAEHHRVSFTDSRKVYEWDGVRWTQTKGPRPGDP